jgi:PAS domain S-box-containing protein
VKNSRSWLVPLGLLAETAVLATTYLATAKIGFLLAIPPENVTALWPPSGLALAAVLLLRGYRAGVAVWIGSFLANGWFFFTSANPEGPQAAMAADIASGATAQALLGAWLVRWCFRAACPPECVRAVLTFIGLEALACFVGATCGVVCLFHGGLISRAEWAQVWGTWWLGNCAGVLVVAPPLLVFGLALRPASLFHRGILLFVCSGVGLSLLGFAIGQDLERQMVDAKFHGDAEDMLSSLRRSVQDSPRAPASEYLRAGRTWQPWMILLGGISFTSLLTVFLAARRRAEHKLWVGEGRYRLLVEHVSDVIWMADLDLRLTYISASVQQLTGFSPEERLAQSVEERLLPTSLGNARQLLAVALQEARAHGDASQVRTFEYQTTRKDGRVIWCESRTAWLQDGYGRPVGVLGATHDISARKEAEQALRGQQAILQNIIAHFPAAVFWKDLQSRYLGCNERMARHLGRASPADVIGKTDHDLPFTRDQADFYVRCDQDVLANGKPLLDFTETQRRPDGKEAVLLTSKVPLRDAEGRVIGILGVYSDITERKRLEDHFRQVRKMEAIGRLAGGVAHDFNNLLTVILGCSELLQGQMTLAGPARILVEQIRNSGERAAGLTRQLLAFSRKQIVAPKALELNTFVRDMEQLLRRLIGEDINLVTSLGASLGRVKIDPGQMEQLLLNLTANARDAMPQGGTFTLETTDVELSTSQGLGDPEFHPGNYVMLAVHDTGSGMTEEVKAQIFEPFFTTKEVGKGTGLGLATVYGIVKMNRGLIDVESSPGKGTVFRVYLPRVDEEPSPVAAPPLNGLRRGTETILLVEDEGTVRSLGRRVLELAGYTVREAQSGPEALQISGKHQGTIHLLVTGVVMPQMSGRQLAERVLAQRPGLKVLYLSGYTEDAVFRHGVVETDMPFLSKPFMPAALTEKVREVLDQ